MTDQQSLSYLFTSSPGKIYSMSSSTFKNDFRIDELRDVLAIILIAAMCFKNSLTPGSFTAIQVAAHYPYDFKASL